MPNLAARTWRPYSPRTYQPVTCSHCGRATRAPGHHGYRYRLQTLPRRTHPRATERACAPCWKVWG